MQIVELGLVFKDEWMKLRKDRNEIAHEYSFNQEEVVDGINLIAVDTDALLAIYDGFFSYCVQKFEFVKNSSVLI